MVSFLARFFTLSFFLISLGCQPAKPKPEMPMAEAPAESPAGLDLRDRVRRLTLDNGLRVLLLKRGVAPVFSVQIKVTVGGIEEEPGTSGLAHFFEHMAFKGTEQIGTLDYGKEKPILDELEIIGTQVSELRRASQGTLKDEDPKLKPLLDKLADLQNQAAAFANKNEFVEIFQRNGGADLNASTSNDYTTYYVSLPANKLELWAYLESTRLRDRVLREFFSEIAVVREERRMRYDNSPDGLLYEALNNTAFSKSPYRVPVIGYANDIPLYTPAVARAFYKKYYVPARMVISMVGNFDVDQAETLIRKYFSRLPKGENPIDDFPKEKLEDYPRTVTIKGKEKSRFYLAYHRPAHPDPDDIIMDVAQSVLCEGRTSRLYKRLVLQEKKVASVDCYASIPGARLDSLFTFYAIPLAEHTNQEIAADIRLEVKKLMEEGPDDKELQIVKNNFDADLIYSLDSNEGLASKLAFYESLTGDWQYLYELQKRIHSITAADVQRVLKTYFVPGREVLAAFEQEIDNRDKLQTKSSQGGAL